MSLSYWVCAPPVLGVSFTDSAVCVGILESAPWLWEKGVRARCRLSQRPIIEVMLEQLPRGPGEWAGPGPQVPPSFDPCVLSTEMLPWW